MTPAAGQAALISGAGSPTGIGFATAEALPITGTTLANDFGYSALK